VKSRLIFLPFLIFIFLTLPVTAGDTGWTEKKLGKIILKADKAARQRDWPRAIKYGEQMLQGSAALDQRSDARYINLLKNLNRYYDRAGRLQDVGPRLREAYMLSRQHLSPAHATTIMNRHLLYKLLISTGAYQDAIPLVLEGVSLIGKGEEDNLRRHHYLKQLYSLYGLTGQLAKEENALVRFLELNRQLFGSDNQDNVKGISVLAKNYCRQRKFEQFRELVEKHDLKYVCR